MALVNYATREINAKIVYYGPGLSGKTTNIHYVFNKVKPKNKGKLISLATQGDRTLFFDFLPVELGSVKGFKTRFHLYTVPGQVFYNSTRKLVLKGADGVVFVADSQKMMRDENLQSLENLRTNLSDMGIDFNEFPVILQYNKMDLPNASSVEEMEEYLNPTGRPYFAASAIKGEGVLVALTAIVKNILQNLKQGQAGDFEGFREDDEPVEHREDDTVTIKINEPVQSFMDIKSDSEPSVPSMPIVPSADILQAVNEPAPEEAAAPYEEEDEPLEAELQQDEPVLTLDEARLEQAEEKPEEVHVVEDFGVTDFHVAELLQNNELLEEIPSPTVLKPALDVLVYESGPKSGQSFMIPVRITTASGVKEINLKVKVDIGLLGEGSEEITKIEALQPVSKIPISPRSAPDAVPLPAPADRQGQVPAPMPKPSSREKRPSVFHRFLGIK